MKRNKINPEFHLILSRFQNQFFQELAEVIIYELQNLGLNASISDNDNLLPTENDVFVLLSPHEFIALEGDEWLGDSQLLGRTIVISAEQPNQSGMFMANAAIAMKAGGHLDFSSHSVHRYQKLGLNTGHFPFGYTSLWDIYSSTSESRCANSGGVLFLGSASHRRLKVLALCAESLTDTSSRLVVSDNSTPNIKEVPGFITGQQKRKLIASSKLLLNIHQSDEPYLEWLRFSEAFHCGIPVLTETSMMSKPFLAGRDFFSVDVESLPWVIESVLDNEERLKEVRESAYEVLKANPFSKSIELLAEIGGNLTLKPIPRRIPKLLRKEPLLHPGNKTVRELDITSFESIVRQSLRELRLELQGVRRDLSEIHAKSPRENGLSAKTEILHESPLFTEANPTISVLVSLYNHSHYITEMLDSLLSGGDLSSFETIVVDDGSTDNSSMKILEWCSNHPEVNLKLLRFRINKGLPFARNRALEQARGKFCFVLDSDNAVFPGAFDKLRTALMEDPGAWFSYGVLQAFNTEGPVYTLGVFPWQPWRFRHENYIDAMALIKTDRLRAIGGYTTDRRLYGFEDFDLWCRIAEMGGHGAHVPSFVGRYRVSPVSMVNLANLTRIPSISALEERYPRLMKGEIATNYWSENSPSTSHL